ncbi:alkyl/aryl-sulfatase [Microbulbifer pacificus]|uniref:Linear primary-alkylsulfatase n=1 Tax=Microbulbifer pacificus TaxID=407164 RepID=A0AAU0N3F8_9GAMM|nr:alkyl sulfatase dimerization domain-containing protein [Microbulbifer pacificus]WOX06814.1 alkyl sulfatase dimerization domain-containing protein [Microbulbifer pacificus]
MLKVMMASGLGALMMSGFCTAAIAKTEATPKPASAVTLAQQQAVRDELPFADRKDFELAEKGLLKRPQNVEIRDDQGNLVWSLEQYDFLSGEQSYDTINPSLERQAKLNMHYGLYKVTDRIYQVRGYDLSNITFVAGDTGWIVFDPLLTPAPAKAAFKLVTENLGERPVRAVVYSHAHIDHFGGVKGVVSQQQVDSGEVQVIAPRGFMEHAVKENVLAGNAMLRRGSLQYGNVLAKGPKGQVDSAIGKGASTGVIGLIAPTRTIDKDEETLVIDGIEMRFQNTPHTESPAEMNTYFPQFKALWTAENVTGTLHNVYTLRGAEIRDAQGWSKYINRLIHGYGKEAEVIFASHSWPRWGNEYLLEVLRKQRDIYGYLHDQTLNLANKGVTISEIQDAITVPDSLAHEWYNRGYHGSYKHNAKGIINKYLGYFDMNPANLNPLSPADSGPRYVEALGGAEAVMQKAREAFDKGDYRWAAELLNHLVFAQPDNTDARLLQADIFEQMGYQAENMGWRNAYLVGAYELRNGPPTGALATRGGPDFISAMSTELMFDFVGVKLDTDKAEGKELIINFVLPDRDETFLLELANSHLNNIAGVQSKGADVTVTMNRSDLDKLFTKQQSFQELVKSGALKMDGEPQAFIQLMSMLEEFPFWFNVVTP